MTIHIVSEQSVTLVRIQDYTSHNTLTNGAQRIKQSIKFFTHDNWTAEYLFLALKNYYAESNTGKNPSYVITTKMHISVYI